MNEGSTPTQPKHARRSHPDSPTYAVCTMLGHDGKHPRAADGRPVCPVCYPQTYAAVQGKHRAVPGRPAFGYLTTEAHGVTR